ncbi:hypothetical protein D3C72_2079500 [compost metagenome]
MQVADASGKLLAARLTDVQWAAVLDLVEEHERELAPMPGPAGGVRSLRGRLEVIRREAITADPLRG